MPPEETNVTAYVVCPDEQCRSIAAIEWTRTNRSTDGPIEMAKVLCPANHGFLMPRNSLEPA